MYPRREEFFTGVGRGRGRYGGNAWLRNGHARLRHPPLPSVTPAWTWPGSPRKPVARARVRDRGSSVAAGAQGPAVPPGLVQPWPQDGPGHHPGLYPRQTEARTSSWRAKENAGAATASDQGPGNTPPPGSCPFTRRPVRPISRCLRRQGRGRPRTPPDPAARWKLGHDAVPRRQNRRAGGEVQSTDHGPSIAS